MMISTNKAEEKRQTSILGARTIQLELSMEGVLHFDSTLYMTLIYSQRHKKTFTFIEDVWALGTIL